MPYTARQKRAAGAELGRRRRGERPKLFKGATTAQLKDLASGPLKKPTRKSHG